MRVHLPNSYTPVLTPLALLLAALACADRDEPVGVRGVSGLAAEPQGGGGRSEERRAVELSRQLPGLAGFYYDTAGNVIVALKEGARAAVTRATLRGLLRPELTRSRRRHPAADIIIRTGARYAFLELQAWRDRLKAGDVLAVPGVVWLDLDEVANRVVVGLEAGTDPSSVRTRGRELGVPAEALAFAAGAPYVPQATLQDQLRPIQGGIQIQRVSGTTRATCTLGFSALWNNQQVFLTAGHCSPDLMAADSVEQFQPLAPLTAADSAAMTGIGREIARASQPCGRSLCAHSDAAIYGPVPSAAWGLGHIARPSGGCFPGPCNPPNLTVAGAWVIDTTREGFVVNDLVSQIGSSTGWSQGYVTRTCVDVAPVHGVTYSCQMFADYGSGDGDSGSPILLDVQGGADSMVTLGGIHSGRSGSNAVFSPWSGIVRDYGSLVVVPVPQDTSRPAVPDSLGLPDDSARTVASPFGTEQRYYRDIVGVVFDDTTSGGTIRALLAKYQAVIIGGGAAYPYPVYYLQVPDPGGTYTAIDSIAQALGKEPGVFASPLPQWRSRIQVRSRYPTDGPSARRADWASPTDATRGLITIRAPLAWGCETGTYGQSARVAIMDRQFEVHDDLMIRQIRPPINRIQFRTVPTMDDLEHGNRVAGIFGATGDNGIGIAGVMWHSDLTLYELGSAGGETSYPYGDFVYHLIHISDTLGTRILSMSVAFGLPSDTASIRWITQALSIYFRRGGILVYAIGNDPQARPTLSALRTTTDTAYSGFDKAVAILRDSLGFSDNIITVGATDTTGAFLNSTTFWLGGTDILAPGQQILTLGISNTTSIAPYGTSYATPYVAGVAAQLLSMDPTLTAAQVKSYLLRGARQPRVNSRTGQIAPPPPVSGAPDTVYQLDAYGALTLLASERTGIPLCGNRVWTTGQAIVAERDTVAHTTETLATLAERADLVNARHGGRRVEAFSFSSGSRAFALQDGQWVSTTDPPTTLDGGTFSSLFQASHDLDSGVVYSTSGNGIFDLRIHDYNTGTETPLTTISEGLAGWTDSTCNLLSRADSLGVRYCAGYAPSGSSERAVLTLAYSPLGDEIVAVVTRRLAQLTGALGFVTCPGNDSNDPDGELCQDVTYREDPERTAVHLVRIQTGQDTVEWTVTGEDVFWEGVSEDGAQLALGEGIRHDTWTLHWTVSGTQLVGDPSVYEACGVGYRAYRTGTPLRPLIQLSGTACSDLGRGSISPAPPATQ